MTDLENFIAKCEQNAKPKNVLCVVAIRIKKLIIMHIMLNFL